MGGVNRTQGKTTMSKIDDTERIEFLEHLNEQQNVILRISLRTGGFRLHETTRAGGSPTIRQAIDKVIIGVKKQIEKKS